MVKSIHLTRIMEPKAKLIINVNHQSLRVLHLVMVHLEGTVFQNLSFVMVMMIAKMVQMNSLNFVVSIYSTESPEVGGQRGVPLCSNGFYADI